MSSKSSGGENKKVLTVLRGYNVQVDGFDIKAEHKAKAAIQRLGGTVVESGISEKPTVLIIKTVGTKEFQLAQKNCEVPCVSLKWLSDSYSQQSALPFDSYLVTSFHGLTIACTQISSEERRVLQRLVEENGGLFSNILEKDVSTHLIANKAEGEKYEYAKSWGNVYIVNLAWIEACARNKKWINERDYAVISSKDKKRLQYNAAEAAKGNKSRKLDFLLSAKGEGSSSSSIASKTLSSRCQSVLFEEKSRSGYKPSTIVEALDMINLFLAEKVDVRSFPSFFDISPAHLSLFANDVFFFDGYPLEIADYMTTLVLAAGGHCSLVLVQDVTKVLCGPYTENKLFVEAHRHPIGVQFVNFVWLIDTLFGLKRLLHLLRSGPSFPAIDCLYMREVKERQGQGQEQELVSSIDQLLALVVDGCPAASLDNY